MQIAVIGATGMLGQPVTHELIRAGFPVRIIARDVRKAGHLFPQATFVSGDMNNVNSLVRALSGVDAVYLNLSIRQDEKKDQFHTEAEGLLNLIQASQLAGVRRIGYLSSLIIRYQGMDGFDWWAFDVKQEAVRLIKESGIPYSIFYPSCFMDSLNGTQRLGRFVLMVGRSAVKPWYIAARDYGEQVAKAFRRAQDEQNQEYIIQGPEALTQHEAAERFVASYKKEKLFILTISPILMQLGGLVSQQADYGLHITEAINKYPEVFEATRTWADLGKPCTTIDQFAAQV